MQILTINCPACGGVFSGTLTSRSILCEYCGTRYVLDKEELEALGFVDADGDGYDDASEKGREDGVDGRNDAASYEDDSAEPIDRFAHTLCKEFLRGGDVSQSDFSPSRKIKRGLGLSDGDVILLIHDDTLFKSGKNGFAITASGLYCREFCEPKAVFVSWDEFTAGDRPVRDESYVRQGGVPLCYFSGSDEIAAKLEVLYDRLYFHAQKVR